MLNLGYRGDSLNDLVNNLERAVDVAGREMASDMGRRFKHNIEINTPVATRLLRGSYRMTDIDRTAVTRGGAVGMAIYAWTGEVFTEVEYAPFVERGTGLWGPRRKKYKIQPKKPGGVLAFEPYMRSNGSVVLDVAGSPSKGGMVTVRYVMHPGSPGAHMFRIGAVVTEHEVDEWSYRGLRLFEKLVANPESISQIPLASVGRSMRV